MKGSRGPKGKGSRKDRDGIGRSSLRVPFPPFRVPSERTSGGPPSGPGSDGNGGVDLGYPESPEILQNIPVSYLPCPASERPSVTPFSLEHDFLYHPTPRLGLDFRPQVGGRTWTEGWDSKTKGTFSKEWTSRRWDRHEWSDRRGERGRVL